MPPINDRHASHAQFIDGRHSIVVHVEGDGWSYEGLTCPADCGTCRADNICFTGSLPRAWPASREVAGYVFQVNERELTAGCQTVSLGVVRAAVAASDRMVRRPKAARVPLVPESGVRVRTDGSLAWNGYGVSRKEVLRIRRALP